MRDKEEKYWLNRGILKKQESAWGQTIETLLKDWLV